MTFRSGKSTTMWLEFNRHLSKMSVGNLIVIVVGGVSYELELKNIHKKVAEEEPSEPHNDRI